jgi:Na+(H+)/acetate symporter ActP
MSNELGKVLLTPLMLGMACALLVTVESDDDSQWVTIFPGLASDIGFLGVTLPILVMRLFWRGAWENAELWTMGAKTLVSLCLFVHLPVLNALANNQSVRVSDSFFCIIFLMLVFVSFKRQKYESSCGCLKHIML